jgi:hypothetical protein
MGRLITTDAIAEASAGTGDTPGTDEPDPETDPETGPLRRCIVTRARVPKEGMIRFVVGPGRVLVPDLAAGLPGRGLWLSARADVLERARARGIFAKAARGPVVVPPDLASMLCAGLTQRIADHLGFARRAGQAVAGFEKAREWLVQDRAALLVQATDGSAEERARLRGHRVTPVVAPLDAAALGLVFGRERVVHVAVAPGRLAQVIEDEAGRLAGFADQHDNGAGGSGAGAPGADGIDQQAGA